MRLGWGFALQVQIRAKEPVRPAVSAFVYLLDARLKGPSLPLALVRCGVVLGTLRDGTYYIHVLPQRSSSLSLNLA